MSEDVTAQRTPDAIGRMLDAVDRLSDWGAWASVACIAGILVLIAGEVAARNLFNISLDFAWEFSSFLMGAAFMLGAAYSLRSGAQIRVMAVLENLPPRARHALDLFATACAAVAIGYLTWALAQLAWLSFTRGSRSDKASELPLWIAQAPLALGAALFALQALARFVRLVRGEPGEDVRLRVGQDAEGAAS
jgi:TRAP-type C4-dicarboxylate transport system permease small subunit